MCLVAHFAVSLVGVVSPHWFKQAVANNQPLVKEEEMVHMFPGM